MSLFPAYSNLKDLPSTSETENNTDWLANPSFAEEKLTTETAIEKTNLIDNNKNHKDLIKSRKHKKKDHIHKHKKHKKDKKHKKLDQELKFTGTEEYYVDKSSERSYLTTLTLHRPTCPRYKKYSRSLGYIPKYQTKIPNKRYYQYKMLKKNNSETATNLQLNDVEFSDKSKYYNKKLGENPGDINLWMEFINLQDFQPMKIINKTQLTERKMNILDKALKENPSNEQLYKLYVDIINNTYPSFDVSKILEKLLLKDSTNYILWNAQILATQQSMARCNVPDVLKLYDNCMKNMYNKCRYDEVMLKLYTNCLFFLRQSGLYEQFFALIKLSLELNVSENKFSNIQPNEQDQNILVEYEEVILQSGLPMAEIWLRIEKLRQNFNFLPIPNNLQSCDPQRMVFNEDIVQFVYPLTNCEYLFQLILIILRLLKIPIPMGYTNNNKYYLYKEECIAQFDCIEEILAVFLYRNFLSTYKFDCIFFDLIKDLSIGPSYITNNIGHEIYLKQIMEIILIAIDCFTDTTTNNIGRTSSINTTTQSINISRRNILILLWLKFERILLYIDKLMGKLMDEEKQKKLRNKVKNFLKRNENRNILLFYIEYGNIEYELGNIDGMENIFITAIEQSIINHQNQQVDDENYSRSVLTSAYITYIELIMNEQQYEKALILLICLSLGENIREQQQQNLMPSETQKLLALNKITERLNDLIFIEKNIEIMEIEQHFLPDLLINLIKTKMYLLLLIKSRIEAVRQIEIVLKMFPEQNNRHNFIRESVYEIFVKIIQQEIPPVDNNKIDYQKLYNVIENGLKEFPNNLLLLKLTASKLNSFAWHKISILLLKCNSPQSILFCIAAAKLRYKISMENNKLENVSQYISSDIDTNDIPYKLRVTNLLKNQLTDVNSNLRKNSILWRLYLRSLLDINVNFEKSKNILYAALDECPWNKALYLDGSVFVPQEFSHLQDLIIEKQLRIYALPDELEILRTDVIK